VSTSGRYGSKWATLTARNRFPAHNDRERSMYIGVGGLIILIIILIILFR
jgi:hypothetical protein